LRIAWVLFVVIFTAFMNLDGPFGLTKHYVSAVLLQRALFAVGAGLIITSTRIFIRIFYSRLRRFEFETVRVLEPLTEQQELPESAESNSQDTAGRTPTELDSCADNELSPSDSADSNLEYGDHGNLTILDSRVGTINIDDNKTASLLATLTRDYSNGNARLAVRYYLQGYRQASVSFILSMVFAAAGFVIVGIAVVGYIVQPTQWAGAVVTAVAGAMNEAVGVLFFRRADKGRELMMSLIDRLRDDREREVDFVSAIAMMNQVESDSLKDVLRVATVLNFTKSPVTLADLERLAKSQLPPTLDKDD
jgi:hypothetical protein